MSCLELAPSIFPTNSIMSNVIQLDWSREMTLHLSIGSKLSILQLYISVKIASVYYNYLKLSKVALLQTLKIACSLTKGKLLYTLDVYFTENIVMVSFHCTHYLISIFFFTHLSSKLLNFIWDPENEQLLYQQFYFKPTLTLHKPFSHVVRNPLDFLLEVLLEFYHNVHAKQCVNTPRFA